MRFNRPGLVVSVVTREFTPIFDQIVRRFRRVLVIEAQAKIKVVVVGIMSTSAMLRQGTELEYGRVAARSLLISAESLRYAR